MINGRELFTNGPKVKKRIAYCHILHFGAFVNDYLFICTYSLRSKNIPEEFLENYAKKIYMV